MNQGHPKERVLLVDDAPANISVLLRALKPDYDISVATRGEDAISIASAIPQPDIILLDIVMPGMDGYEVCRSLKADEFTKNIPVIFLTSMSEKKDEAKGLALGAMDYIRKPFSLPIVKARLKAHLELKRKTDILERMSYLDGLTGVANRRRFDETLKNEWRRMRREGSWLSILLADIDHFKAYNDRYGHTEGDACLRLVAQALKKIAQRPSDLLARYGGEEFVALLAGTDEKGAAHLAEQMRAAVESLNIPHTYSDVSDRVSISVGVASVVPAADSTWKSLIDSADNALYAAKIRGRNRVVSYTDTLVETNFSSEGRRGKGLPPTPGIQLPPVFEAGRPLPRQRILIVDDAPANIRLLLTALKEDYDVSVATSGEDALTLVFSENRPDLILLDIIMPGMSGYEVCERLKADRKTSHIPIVFVTQKGEETDEAVGLEMGAVDYIIKPFSLPIVMNRLKNHLEIKRLRDMSEDAGKAKDRFLAMIGHDIRTPLNAIVGATELLKETELTSEQFRFITDAASSTDMLLSLLNDLLDFSRIEAGKLKLTFHSFSISEAVRQVVDMHALTAHAKGLALNCFLDPKVPEYLLGDRARLQQVLMNLLGNAIKFTDSGEVGLRVELGSENEHSVVVRITVSDTGIGIPDESLNAVFHEFVQAQQSRYRRYGGTGLGLAICSRLVYLMAGRIWVESKVGVGSAFHVELPMKKGAEQAKADPSVAHGERLNILVVEDDTQSLKVMKKMLDNHGHLVTTAVNGEDAVRLFEEKHFDLILMDVQMIVMDGLEATKIIRERESTSGVRTPIIATTAHDMEGDRERFLTAGMDGHIAKPITMQSLWECIDRIRSGQGTSKT